MTDKKGILFVVSGSSGSGKGTVLGKLLKISKKFVYSVSATTRKPRKGEKDGVNYFFVTKEQFETSIKNGEMLEYAEYCGNFYGTFKSYVCSQLEKGINVILEIEVCGAKQIKEKIPEAVLIFITPPNYEELKRRLYNRGTESEEIAEKRLNAALDEIKAAKNYDYVIINKTGEAEKTAKDIIDISEGKYSKNPKQKEILENFTKNIIQ